MKSSRFYFVCLPLLNVCVLPNAYAVSEQPSNPTYTRSSACEQVLQPQAWQTIAEKVDIETTKLFAWGKGPEQAKLLLQELSVEQVQRYKRLGLMWEQALRWQRFYETELRRNPCDANAPFRAAFLKKVIQLW